MPDLHDMGGNTEFFGPVDRDETAFHADWERRVMGVVALSQANLNPNIDAFRRAVEDLPRETYLRSYFARWLAALERLLVDDGYLGEDEVDARLEGREAAPGPRNPPRLRVALTTRVLRMGMRPLPPLGHRLYSWIMGYRRRQRAERRFAPGDRVRTLAEKPSGHTRLPGYAVGKVGTVVMHHGAMVFPDAHAQGRGEDPRHCYTVAFDAADLWDDAEPDTSVHVDLFEPYLEPA